MLEYFSYILGFIGALGGLSGVATTWYYWKRFKRKIKIIPLESWYKISEEIEFDATRNYTTFRAGINQDVSFVELNFLVVNDSEVSISITDAVALVKYSKDLLKVDRGYSQTVFGFKPAIPTKLPITIKPHHAERIKLEFNFKGIKIELLEREIFKYFTGWLDDIPIFIVSEFEKREKREQLPIILRLILHIDAREKKFVDFHVFNAEQFKKLYSGTGTLSIVDIEEAKKEFWESG